MQLFLAQSSCVTPSQNIATTIVFYLLALLCGGSALGVVISRNIVRMAVFLMFTLLGDYLAPFEIASVLLLVVMIGAAYLAKGRRREGGES